MYNNGKANNSKRNFYKRVHLVTVGDAHTKIVEMEDNQKNKLKKLTLTETYCYSSRRCLFRNSGVYFTHRSTSRYVLVFSENKIQWF